MTSMAGNNSNPLDDFINNYLEAAAAGDMSKIQLISSGTFDMDVTNEKGWTALMFASRNGCSNVVKFLVDKGCDITKINASGQTALDIAKFWSQTDIEAILKAKRKPDDFEYSGLPNQGMCNFFGHNSLDRANHRRKDTSWLEAIMKKPTTKFCLFTNLSPYALKQADHGRIQGRSVYKLLTVAYSDVKPFLETKPLLIFLGLDQNISTGGTASEEDECPAWFALDVSLCTDETIQKINPHAQELSLYPAGMQLEKKHAGILAQARSVLAWHDRYSFCPTCGSKTFPEEAGYKRTCENQDCRSLKGIHNTSYPRLDPTVIMAVISPDKKHVLLGRGERHPKNMWSCLAGFMEAGESIEDAVRRETFEEAGIKVGRVEYHSCQPWPMPCSLMIGCLGFAETENIEIDKDELADAQWYGRKEVVQMLTRQHPQGLFVPPDQAIAHQLIKAWVHMTANL